MKFGERAGECVEALAALPGGGNPTLEGAPAHAAAVRRARQAVLEGSQALALAMVKKVCPKPYPTLPSMVRGTSQLPAWPGSAGWLTGAWVQDSIQPVKQINFLPVAGVDGQPGAGAEGILVRWFVPASQVT